MTDNLLGTRASLTTTVDSTNTASAMGSGNLDVFATPMMIALMEHAACKCLSDTLEPGQTSVGTEVCVQHTAASPLGATITATAVITAIDGRKVEFTVSACDSSGEIGKGTHSRAIVDAERLLGKAAGRL